MSGEHSVGLAKNETLGYQIPLRYHDELLADLQPQNNFLPGKPKIDGAF